MLNYLLHVTEEEGHNQCGDVCSIDIGIGHDDHLVVADLRQVEGFGVILRTEGYTQCGEYITYFLALKHLVLHSLLDVEDLTAQREDSLVYSVATCLGCTACGVTLDEEEFALGRIFGCAISKFAGESSTAERGLAENRLTSVACGYTCLCSEDHFLNDTLGVVGVLFEVVLQRLGYGGVHHAGYLGVAEFGFCLTFELRLCDLDGDHCRQSFAEIVGVDGRVAVFVLEFGFLEHLTVLSVLLHDACERSAEACDVCTALYGVDIVDVGVYVFVEVGVVDHCYLNRRAVLVGIEVNNLADERCAVAVDETYELGETFL